jgi:addiction module HigA family antidote
MKTKMFNPPHPGEVLKGLYLDELELTITGAAKALSVSRQSLSEIVNKHHGVSPEMALRLAKAFNTEAEMWLNMQKNHDLWQAEKR